jgi:hypothetical protein
MIAVAAILTDFPMEPAGQPAGGTGPGGVALVGRRARAERLTDGEQRRRAEAAVKR